MVKLIIMKGLPASGKSTEAFRLVKEEGYKRVNKDDLRAMIDASKWSKKNEELVKSLEYGMVITFLDEGFNVVVDDTNFAYIDFWEELANKKNIESEVKFFDTPLLECIMRDAKRGEKAVGEKVIMRMYEQYLRPEHVEDNLDLEDCYIFDIDGTLAKMNGRSPYDYTKVHTDIENRDIVFIQKVLQQKGIKMIIMSGRESGCRKETEQWLKDNEINYDGLFMRAEGDMRDDRIVKRELYEEHVKDLYNVLAVFDDRNRVVEMWRSLGLTCLQVDYGNF